MDKDNKTKWYGGFTVINKKGSEIKDNDCYIYKKTKSRMDHAAEVANKAINKMIEGIL